MASAFWSSSTVSALATIPAGCTVPSASVTGASAWSPAIAASYSGTGVGLIVQGRMSPGSTRRITWDAPMSVLPSTMLMITFDRPRCQADVAPCCACLSPMTGSTPA